MMKKILVTGAAGFIGYHLVRRLADEDCVIVGLDNINDYYDVRLKYARLSDLGIESKSDAASAVNSMNDGLPYGKIRISKTLPNFSFIKLDLEDRNKIEDLFASERFDYVVNLAAQAGVRYSISNPHAYIQSNIVGFMNILESSRHNSVKHLIYASSSSVYGTNSKIPFEEHDRTDGPASLYAATKKSNELMAYTYSHLYNLPTTGLRFFTVYGPWGRPDMSPILFADAITNGEILKVFNNGEMERDFTFIDDIVEGIRRVIDNDPAYKPPYQLLNIGNGSPVNLLTFIELMEESLGKAAKKDFLPMQMGDVKKTWADVGELLALTGYKPTVGIREGVKRFVDWYLKFYKV